MFCEDFCIAIFAVLMIPGIRAINCYECTSSEGRDCTYQAKSCPYGFFGCVKIAIYSGGVDRMGNWENDQERRIVSMLRGCSVIPLRSVDMCTQTPLLGNRIITCTCFNDYCNASYLRSSYTAFIVILLFLF